MKPNKTLLEVEMTRKQFLATLGVGALSVFGIKNFIDLFHGKSLPANLKQPEASQPTSSFGSRKFGA